MNVAYSLADFRDMIAFLESELGDWYSYSDLPAFVLVVECCPQFFYEVEEIIFIGETAFAI
jgi:hypothetical protein